MVKVKSADGKFFIAKALIDQCSQSSFVSESLCQDLKLKRSKANIRINGVGDLSPCSSKGLVKLSISPRFDAKDEFSVDALVLPNISGYKVTESSIDNNWNHLKQLQLADPNFLKSERIEILLGSEIHALIVESSVIKGKVGEPIATNTKLGWVISGPSGMGKSNSSTFIHCANNTDLYDLMAKFWVIESTLVPKYVSPEDKYCEEHFLRTYSRNESGRYVVRLPLKEGALNSLNFHLGQLYASALRTLHYMERKFDKEPLFKEKYVEFMQNYIETGHMSHVPNLSEEEKRNCYFLPHHGILQGRKKLRVVFNGSSQTNGTSLNDLLYTGPCLLHDLFDLLMRWRTYKYVFICDIEQMFRQFVVHEDDRHFQWIVWRQEKSLPIRFFRINVLAYGIKPSPFLAERSLYQLASDHKEQFPLAAEIVEDESYMDDFGSGADTIEEAKLKQVELRELLKVGGLKLRKWAANTPELESWLPQSDLLRGSSIFESDISASILGLLWSPQEDVFYFKVDTQSYAELTKRRALSMICKLFDPLGWLAPVIVGAKIFLQSLWLLKCDWDDNLPDGYVRTFSEFYEKLKALEAIRIPRWIHLSSTGCTVELHGFADASEKAFAAVVYLRVIKEGKSQVTLQCAKTSVAPIKSVSLPRLELCAAHLLTKLVKHFLEKMKFENLAVHLWSDSNNTLAWIRAIPSRWQTFVANRCSEIQTLLPTALWHHIKSENNPADIASRGIDPSLLASHALWWKASIFLSDNCAPWPTDADDIPETILEKRTT